MNDERCAMCRDLGFPDVLAHYKSVTAGGSNTGKAQPALCFDHKHGREPKVLDHLRQQQAAANKSPQPELPKPLRVHDGPELSGNAHQALRGVTPMLCRCGCGTEIPLNLSYKYAPGHRVEKPPEVPSVCSRGCDKSPHRGSCKGMSGNRKAEPVPEPIGVCLCGCGEATNRGYLWGHKNRLKKPPVNTEAAKPTATQYAIVIADLTAKRDRLSAAIEALISLG